DTTRFLSRRDRRERSRRCPAPRRTRSVIAGVPCVAWQRTSPLAWWVSRMRDDVPLETRVAALVVNFQTPDLLETAVLSFLSFYPQVDLTLVDNGSRDDSPALIAAIADAHANVNP